MSFIPDAFVIGAGKAGTSTLWKAAFEHPSLDPSKAKEVNFFVRDYSPEQLEQLYARQFRNTDAIKVDVSPAYSRRHALPGVAKRIYAANKNAKIIYLVRNPLVRIVSHLHHSMYRHRINPGDENRVVIKSPDYIMTSMYFYQLEDYLNYFSKESILLLELEDLSKRPEQFWAALSTFLHISPFTAPARSYNVSEKRYLIPYHDLFYRHVHNNTLTKMYNIFWHVVGIKRDRPILEPDVLETLKMRLRPDAQKLKDEFGIETDKWFT